jgi:hypothetical protein
MVRKVFYTSATLCALVLSGMAQGTTIHVYPESCSVEPSTEVNPFEQSTSVGPHEPGTYTATFSMTTIGVSGSVAPTTKSPVPSPSPAGIVRGRIAVAEPQGCLLSYPGIDSYTIPGTPVTVSSLEDCADYCASVAGVGSAVGSYVGVQSSRVCSHDSALGLREQAINASAGSTSFPHPRELAIFPATKVSTRYVAVTIRCLSTRLLNTLPAAQIPPHRRADLSQCPEA